MVVREASGMNDVRRYATALGLALLLTPSPAAAEDPDEAARFDSKGRPVAPSETPPKPAELTLPERTNDVQPEYTKEALDAAIRGSVFLKLTIDVDGTVQDATVEKGLGYGLDESSLRLQKS